MTLNIDTECSAEFLAANECQALLLGQTTPSLSARQLTQPGPDHQSDEWKDQAQGLRAEDTEAGDQGEDERADKASGIKALTSQSPPPQSYSLEPLI